MSDYPELKQIVEGAIFAADTPLSLENLKSLFEGEQPTRGDIRAVLVEIEADCSVRGYELKKVASGYRFQVKSRYAEWISRLWEERPPRYTRALLETLSLIAYKQPLTRGDIEEVRGVAVSTNIMRSLLEREWIRVVGHRDVPGRPAMYATTRGFLDYFDLNSLDELPPLAEIRELEPNIEELDLGEDLIQINTLELDTEDNPGDFLDEENLDQVSKQVDEIQQNIKRMFHPDAEDLADAEDVDKEADNPDQPPSSATEEPENSSQDPAAFTEVPTDILNAAFAEDESSREPDDES